MVRVNGTGPKLPSAGHTVGSGRNAHFITSLDTGPPAAVSGLP
jgi:hypothetical protein